MNSVSVIINVQRSSGIVPIILVRFQSDLNFLNRFLKNSSNFIKICPVEADLFYIDRHIDIIMLVAFHIFANTACVKIV